MIYGYKYIYQYDKYIKNKKEINQNTTNLYVSLNKLELFIWDLENEIKKK